MNQQGQHAPLDNTFKKNRWIGASAIQTIKRHQVLGGFGSCPMKFESQDISRSSSILLRSVRNITATLHVHVIKKRAV